MSLTRRRGFSVGNYARAGKLAWSLGKQLGASLKRRYSSGSSSSQSQGSKRMKSYEQAPLTAERDIRVSYKRRPMSRRRRRRYVRQYRKFKSMFMKTLPARIFQFVHIQTPTALADTSRYFGCFMGMPANSFYDNNLGEVFNNITNGTAADEKGDAMKLRIDHMSLGVVIRNNTSLSSNSGVIDLDVYKVVFKRDIPLDLWAAGLGIESFLAVEKNRLRQPFGMDIEVGDTGTGIATAQQNAGTSSTTQVVGDTLWNNPTALRYIKVLKQWKVQIPQGGVVQFNWRDSRNHVVPRTDAFGNSSVSAKSGLTCGYIFNMNGRWVVGAPSQFQQVDVVVEQYTRYNCKVLPGTSPTLVYDGV